MMDNKGVYGLNMLQLFDEPSIEKYNPIFTAFDEVLKKFEEGKYRVIVGKTFPLTQVDQAHSHLQGRESLGKVILLPLTQLQSRSVSSFVTLIRENLSQQLHHSRLGEFARY